MATQLDDLASVDEEIRFFGDDEEMLDDLAAASAQPDIEIPTDRPLPGIVDIGEFEFTITRIVSVKPDRNGFFNIRFAARCLRGEPTGNAGRELIDGLSLSPDAAFRRYQFLDAIHAPTNRPLKKSELVGQRFWASTKHDFYNDVASAKIAAFLVGPTFAVDVPQP